MEPRTVVPAGSRSRSLMYKDCKPYQVPEEGLGLQKSKHQRDQLEGMWLDGPVRGHNGQLYGNLHVWYTSIRGAQEAKSRITALEFEFDPCSRGPENLMLYLDESNEVPIFRHHEPFVNLVALDENSILRGACQGMINVAQAYWRFRAPMWPTPDNMTSIAAFHVARRRKFRQAVASHARHFGARGRASTKVDDLPPDLPPPERESVRESNNKRMDFSSKVPGASFEWG